METGQRVISECRLDGCLLARANLGECPPDSCVERQTKSRNLPPPPPKQYCPWYGMPVRPYVAGDQRVASADLACGTDAVNGWPAFYGV